MEATQDLEELLGAAKEEASEVARRHKQSVIECRAKWNPTGRGPAYLVTHGKRWGRREFVKIEDVAESVVATGISTRLGHTADGLLECEGVVRDGAAIRLSPSPIPVAEARVRWLEAAFASAPVINDAPWNQAAVAALLGRTGIGIQRAMGVSNTVLDIASEHLNESQLSALQRAATHDAFVWGPPGTGKSRVLAWIAATLIRAGRSVLLTAPTNAAVDCLLERTRMLLDRELAIGHGRAGYVAIRWAGGVRSTPDPATAGLPRLHAATLARCLLEPTFARTGLVDDVIVDEAGQAMLPDLLAAAACGTGHVVVGGDPFQLGPVVVARSADAGRALRAQPFAGLPGGKVPASMIASLEESYRLPKRAVEGLRSVSYANTALRAATRQRREQLVRTGVGEVTVIAPQAASGNGVPEGFTAGVLEWLLDQNAGAKPDPDVMVLAPTHNDVRRIRSELKNRGEMLRVRQLSTIHAAQGGEAAIVLVDATRYQQGSPFLEGRRPMDEASRMWTVALSRATHHVVLLVPPQLLQARGRTWIERYLLWAAEEARVCTLDLNSRELADVGPGFDAGLMSHPAGLLDWDAACS
ncbi:MAG: AAA family ATPase [Gemmatimonadaceae bacterium]|jgi:hypothetical protein|nr:AAA family ATPase [Gemmatimonadaceae bacterium]